MPAAITQILPAAINPVNTQYVKSNIDFSKFLMFGSSKNNLITDNIGGSETKGPADFNPVQTVGSTVINAYSNQAYKETLFGGYDGGVIGNVGVVFNGANFGNGDTSTGTSRATVNIASIDALPAGLTVGEDISFYLIRPSFNVITGGGAITGTFTLKFTFKLMQTDGTLTTIGSIDIYNGETIAGAIPNQNKLGFFSVSTAGITSNEGDRLIVEIDMNCNITTNTASGSYFQVSGMNLGYAGSKETIDSNGPKPFQLSAV